MLADRKLGLKLVQKGVFSSHALLLKTYQRAKIRQDKSCKIISLTRGAKQRQLSRWNDFALEITER